MVGLNSLFYAVKRRARGYRSVEHMTAMLYLLAGKPPYRLNNHLKVSRNLNSKPHLMSKNCLIIGGTGFLGCELSEYLSRNCYNVWTAGRSTNNQMVVDFNNSGSIMSAIESVCPQLVINLAAATNVDKCEADVQMATSANTIIPLRISEALSKISNTGIHFVHISTDQVYSGEGNHSENQVMPTNIYGLTKLAGEFAVRYPQTTILRTNFVGKSRVPHRKSFSDWIVESFLNKSSVTLYSDVIFNPVHTTTLNSAIVEISRKMLFGTFNYGSKGGISKSEFALRLARLLDLSNDNARIGNLNKSLNRVHRPLNMTMCVDQIEVEMGLICPAIEDEISKTAKEYINE
jgi:dTDP-4-dehydrorhamnose reductase